MSRRAVLKRKHARLCLVLFYAGAALLILGNVAKRFTHVAGLGDGLLVLAVVLLACAGLVLSRYLRCPVCGKRYARPRWNVFHTDYCSFCRRPFIFDDDTEEGEKT